MQKVFNRGGVVASFESRASKVASRSVAVFYAVMAFFVLAVALVLLIASQSVSQMVGVGIFGLALGGWLVRLSRSRWRYGAGSTAPSQGRAVAPWLGMGDASCETFPSKLKGVSQTNADGRMRQQIIKEKCRPGTALELRREPDNPYDPDAIAVYCGGEQVGYVTAELADTFAEDLDAGAIKMEAVVSEVTGGTPEKPSVGVNIYVLVKLVT